VVREAQMLCKPVIVTNYPTAGSQIKHHIDGVIVPMEISECAKGIVDSLKSNQLRKQIIEYLKLNDYGNVGEVDKIYNLI
jgi:hypothetical protein